MINTEILKVFGTSAKHQKSYPVLPHIFFLSVDTVVITFVKMWIHFDVEAGVEGKEPASPRLATSTLPSCGQGGSSDTDAKLLPTGRSVLSFHPCVCLPIFWSGWQ